MKISELKERTPSMIEQLTAVWESSVRATHHFLMEEEISQIRQYVPQALAAVERLVVYRDDTDIPVAFLGIEGKKVEMLFVQAESRGKGIEKKLLPHAMDVFHIEEPTVNVENPQATGFYEHMGFHAAGRSEKDEQGDNHPILFMKRNTGN